ncbi:unnamed protein product [Victoria cruziana]
MMDRREGEGGGNRMIGEYILGPKIGSGSFAVVWRGWHVRSGDVVAIKEIDRRQLSAKLNESLLKEITILGEINHPNIVRLHDVIETGEKIYLVLEYCTGGDLAAYIHHLGRVSEFDARHFMRHLASGLQVLRKHNLIHRDLKPQNLLLSMESNNFLLKIGDFGFARYLKPQGLADTLCGSPLYMAPEIIQSQKYDAKADLWSVGAILFQLVTGSPPFHGNNQFQLFQNILMCKELQFPKELLQRLNPDCVDLCRCLLRRNPVERLSFEEFFNHKFLAEPIPMVVSGHPTTLPGSLQLVRHKGLSSDNFPSTSHKEPRGDLILTNFNIETGNIKLKSADIKLDSAIDTAGCSMEKSFCHGDLPTSSVPDSLKTVTTDLIPLSTSTTRVNDSLESIVREYVLVNANIASMESISSSLMASMQDQSGSKCADCSFTKTAKSVDIPLQCGEIPTASISGVRSLGSHGSVSSAMLQASNDSREIAQVQRLASTRLRLLHDHAHALSALAKEKLDLGRQLDAFSIELVALTVWKEALGLCKSLADSTTDASTSHGVLPGCSRSREQEGSSTEATDFSRMESVCSRVEQGFISACEQAENLASFLHDMNGNAEMPDAMEIIFQAALTAGKNGAVDELMGNRIKAAAAYSKATDLLSFILTEATSLPLNPPFRMDASERQRLQRYVVNLKAHQNLSLRQQACTSSKQLQGPKN